MGAFGPLGGAFETRDGVSETPSGGLWATDCGAFETRTGAFETPNGGFWATRRGFRDTHRGFRNTEEVGAFETPRFVFLRFNQLVAGVPSRACAYARA